MIRIQDKRTRSRLIERFRSILESVRSSDEFKRLLRDIAADGGLDRVDRAELLMLRRGSGSERLSAAIWKGARRDRKLRRFVEHTFRMQSHRYGRILLTTVREALAGILSRRARTQGAVSTVRGGAIELRVEPPVLDIRQPFDTLIVRIEAPDVTEGPAGFRVVLRVQVVRTGVSDGVSLRSEPVKETRERTLRWVNLYDWSGLTDLLVRVGVSWMRTAYADALAAAERKARGLDEARVRRIRRRLRTSPRRFYGRAKTGERMAGGRLPETARLSRRLVRPRVQATDPSPPTELRRWSDYYRVNRSRIKSRGKQMRRMPWYKEYQRRLRKLALSKRTRQR